MLLRAGQRTRPWASQRTRPWARSVHLGVLQVFKLQPVEKPRGERLKLLFPAGAPRSSEESAAQLAQAVQDGKPVLMTVSALKSLLSSDDPGLPQLGAGGDLARLEGAPGRNTTSGDDGGDSGGDVRRAAVQHGLVALDEQTSALITQHTAPLADVLLADAEQVDWKATVAPEHEKLGDPTDDQRALLHAAAAGDAEGLKRALAACTRLEASQAALPPSGGSALHLAAAGGHQVRLVPSPLDHHPWTIIHKPTHDRQVRTVKLWRLHLRPRRFRVLSLRHPTHLCRLQAAVEALLQAGCSVHAAATNGSTALHWAAGDGEVGVVRALLRAGADTRARSSTWRSTVRGDNSGQTPAHWAAASGQTAALEALLEADPQALVLEDEEETAEIV